MSKKYFSFTDTLGYGWAVMKANLGFFIGLGFLFIIITYLPAVVRCVVQAINLPRELDITLSILLQILGFVINMVIGIGMIKIALAFCDERKPNIGMLFDAFGCFWRYIATTILYGLIVLGGFLLFIVPGIIWAVKFSLCYYFVIDKGLDPIQALKASSRTTMDVKWDLFGFGIVCGLINLLGILCLIIGVFATYPTIMVATALVYRQLMAQTPQLNEFGIGELPVEPDSEPFGTWQEH